MSNRRKILRDVKNLYDEKGPNNYVFAHQLPSFKQSDLKYLAAANQLLTEKMILAVADTSNPDGEQPIAIALNPERLEDVRKELYLWYRDPKFVIPAVVAVLGLAWAIFDQFV